MNALTQAFANIIGYNRAIEAVVQKNYGAALKRNASGSWNCKLSYRTHQALMADGYIKFNG